MSYSLFRPSIFDGLSICVSVVSFQYLASVSLFIELVLTYRPQPDYTASQDKETMIKPLKIDYINMHNEHILIKDMFPSSIYL
jgi:hypothetical protein